MKIILNLFSKGGLLLIFVLVGLEYSCFPIPSEFILPFIGSIAAINGYHLFGVILLSVIVSCFGCLICYLIGYYGGAYLYGKVYNKFGKCQKGLDIASLNFNRYGNVSVFVCRLIPLCRTYISFFAGIFKQSLFEYSLYSILGIFIWNTILIVFGYTLADNWELIGKCYDRYKIVLIIILVVNVGVFLLYKLYKKRKLSKTINGD